MKKSVIEATQIAEPIEQAICLPFPEHQVQAHIELDADVFEERVRGFLSREVDPTAGLDLTHGPSEVLRFD